MIGLEREKGRENNIIMLHLKKFKLFLKYCDYY